MRFRKATLADKERVLEICKNIWDGTDYMPNIFDHWVQEKAGEFTMIEEEGQITGMGKLTIIEPGVGWLEGLRVAPEARSRGYAKEITRYFIQKGKELGLRQLRLSTYYQNYASIHVTEGFGFRRVAGFYITEQEVDPTLQGKTAGMVFQAVSGSADESYVIDTLLNAPEQDGVCDYLGYGWLFKKRSRQLILNEVAEGHVFYFKEDDEIKGSMIVYPDNVKDRGFYYIVMVTGEDEAIEQLLEWAKIQAADKKMKQMAVMIPNHPHLKRLFFNQGFISWEEDQELDENVFIYEYNLLGGEN